jgi:SAM-dependent methyltransferase
MSAPSAAPAPVLDKRGRLASIGSAGDVTLELGCGSRRRIADAITIDALDYECVDVVGDVFAVLARVPDASVDLVFSSHFVEHLPQIEPLLCELRRVLKVGGQVRTIAPHFSNPYFYSDYTHRSFFGLYTFSYLAVDRLFKRRVPQYTRDIGFELVDVRLCFKAPPPFYLRYAFRRAFQSLVNVSVFTKELYESSLCYLFPCYELEYVIVKRR